MNLLSGNVKVRNKKYPIIWTGQNAQHLTERYLDENSLHPFLHVQIQQLAAKSVWEEGKGRTFVCFPIVNEQQYKIVGILHNEFFELKTCYKHG